MKDIWIDGRSRLADEEFGFDNINKWGLEVRSLDEVSCSLLCSLLSVHC